VNISYLMVAGQMILKVHRIVSRVFAFPALVLALITNDSDLKKKFAGILKEHSQEPRPFYCHFTSVIDMQSTKLILVNGKPSQVLGTSDANLVIHSVQDTILRANLKKSSLMA